MLITELKPNEEIVESLSGQKKVFIVGCSGCAEVCETGGEKAVGEMAEKIKEAGFEVVGTVNIDFLCNKALVGTRLTRFKKVIDKADCILVSSCGIGVQAVGNTVGKSVIPLCNTLNTGGFQGLWFAEERCAQCGNCLLEITGGICPITTCTKSLINGPCGGAKNKKCEVDKDRDCGWILIYERLKEIGKLENLKKILPPPDYSKSEAASEIRKGPFWAMVD